MDDALVVNLRDRPGHANREREEAIDRHGFPEQAIESLAAEVLEHEGRHSLVGIERERRDHGRDREQLSELVLVLQSLEIVRATVLGVQHLEHDRATVGVPERTIEERSVFVTERLRDCVRRRGEHERCRDARSAEHRHAAVSDL